MTRELIRFLEEGLSRFIPAGREKNHGITLLADGITLTFFERQIWRHKTTSTPVRNPQVEIILSTAHC